MKTRRQFVVALLLCAALTGAKPPAKVVVQSPVKAHNEAVDETFRSRTLESFMQYYQRGVQEKLYLHTDKPYYAAGDTLWFKGYLVNSVTLMPEVQTKYIYVELVGRADSLIRRVKVLGDSCGFHNSFYLPPSLPEGEYTLCGYTRWQQNEDESLFFRRKIKVYNTVDDAVVSRVSYRQQPDNIEAVVQLANSSGEPLVNQRVSYRLDTDMRLKRGSGRTDDKGVMSIDFAPPLDEKRANMLYLTVSIDGTPYVREHALPSFSKDFDIQFFPEGGDLLPVALQTVAFKAVGANGLGIDVTGKIFDRDSALVTEFASSHLGMGCFSVIPSVGNRFYAEVTAANGATKRVALPEVKMSGVALHVTTFRGAILYKVNMTSNITPDSLALVVQARGRILFAEELTPKNLTRVIRVERAPTGVVQLCVVHKRTGDVLSQRLYFVHGKDLASVAMGSNKVNYGRRENVEFFLRVTDAAGAPARGSFSLSVTDSKVVEADTLSDNILSSLLLCSDLRGHIEQPAYYLDPVGPEVADNLNTLMLTQGWSRYELPQILRREFKSYLFYKEESQVISGEIKGFFGNAARSPQIMIMQPQIGLMEIFKLPGNNKFNISGLKFADSTQFVLQAMSKGGNVRTVELKITPEVFATPIARLYNRRIEAVDNAMPQEFLQQSKERYYYEGGMRVIDMQSVVVTTKRVKTPIINGIQVDPFRSLSSDELSKYGFQDVFSALRRFPGIRVTGNEISVRGSADPPLVFVDNMPFDVESLASVNIHDVESLNLIVGPEASMFGLGASGGVIAIISKTGHVSSPVQLLSVAKVMPLGYKKPTGFYQPRYSVRTVRESNKPDLRTTIAWEPTIHTDSTGVALVNFYTADKSTVYNVVLEGVTTGGEVCRAVTTIRRE